MSAILKLFIKLLTGAGKNEKQQAPQPSPRIKLRYDVVLAEPAETTVPIYLEPDPATLQPLGNGVWKVSSKPARIRLPHDFFASLVHPDGKRAYIWGEKGGVKAAPFRVVGEVRYRGEAKTFLYNYSVEKTSLTPAEYMVPPLEWRIKKPTAGFEGVFTPDERTHYLETYEIILPPITVDGVLHSEAGGDIVATQADVEEWRGVHRLRLGLDMDKAYTLVKKAEAEKHG